MLHAGGDPNHLAGPHDARLVRAEEEPRLALLDHHDLLDRVGVRLLRLTRRGLDEHDAHARAVVGSREQVPTGGRRQLVAPAHAQVDVLELQLVLDSHAVEPGITRRRDAVGLELGEHAPVVGVPGGEVEYQLRRHPEARHARVVDRTAEHEGPGRPGERGPRLVEHPRHPRVAVELAVERVGLAGGQVLGGRDAFRGAHDPRGYDRFSLSGMDAPLHSATGTVESLNVGVPRAVQVNGHMVVTAIWKDPVHERLPLRGVNLLGDDQADRTVHGGPDKVVYAYGIEDTEWWEEELGRSLGPGAFGENLTVRGLPVSGAVIGERWAVGSTLLEVAQPRLPCFKLGLRMGDPYFPKLFTAGGRPGAYLRVAEEGDIGPGDRIEFVSRPAHGVTSALVSRAILSEPELLGAASEATELPGGLREWMEARAAAKAGRGGGDGV